MMGAAATGWQSQPPATRRGNDMPHFAPDFSGLFPPNPRSSTQPLVTTWLQQSPLRPLNTIPAKTQHDDITFKMFEEGCNTIFLFIYLKKKKRRKV